MNGKQAKRLRRAAIGMAAHMVESGRTLHPDGKHAKPQPVIPVDKEDLLKLPEVLPFRSETEVNRPDTLRGIYRYLKKSDYK